MAACTCTRQCWWKPWRCACTSASCTTCGGLQMQRPSGRCETVTRCCGRQVGAPVWGRLCLGGLKTFYPLVATDGTDMEPFPAFLTLTLIPTTHCSWRALCCARCAAGRAAALSIHVYDSNMSHRRVWRYAVCAVLLDLREQPQPSDGSGSGSGSEESSAIDVSENEVCRLPVLGLHFSFRTLHPGSWPSLCVHILAWSSHWGIKKAVQSDQKRTCFLGGGHGISSHQQEEEGRWQYLGGRAPSAELGEAPRPKRAKISTGKGGGHMCGSCMLFSTGKLPWMLSRINAEYERCRSSVTCSVCHCL